MAFFSSTPDKEDVIDGPSGSSPPKTKKKRRFLDGYKTRRVSTEVEEVDRYLADDVAENGDVSQLDRYPTIKSIVIGFLQK